MDPEHHPTPGLHFALPPEGRAQLLLALKLLAGGMVLCVFLLAPLVRGGFFREQARQKQARGLVESKGYAYCAIWGDKTDPISLMSMNSPMHPTWSGQPQADGTYLMTFSYRRSGVTYRHQWRVDLMVRTVTAVTDNTRVPVRVDESTGACSES